MAMTDSDIAVVTTATEPERSYVDWPAIVAGIVLASAISLVLIAFGSAVGLSFADFDARDGASPIWIGIAAATWLLWVQVSSFMAGGYLTGRLRRRVNDATEDEVDVRDGAHGLLVWAGALVIGALLAASGLGAAANAVGSAASTATMAASNVAGGAAEGAASDFDPNAYLVDTLFRSAPVDPAAETAVAPAPASSTAAPAAGPNTTTSPTTATTATPATATPATTAPATAVTPAVTASGNIEAARGEAIRILGNGAVSGDVPEADRTYLVQLVSTNTALTPDEAEARVDEVMTNVEAARTEAMEAAETARKVGILAAFLIAAVFLVSGAGAYWAATMGGKHRDENVAIDFFGR